MRSLLHVDVNSLFDFLDATKWKSNLRSNRPVLSIVDKLTNCPGKCLFFEVADQDLKLLANASSKGLKNEKAQQLVGFVPKKPGNAV